MSQRKSLNGGDLSPAAAAGAISVTTDSNNTTTTTAAPTNHSPPLAAVNYGTIKSIDIPFIEQTSGSGKSSSPIVAPVATTETPPKPAVRRKIQRQQQQQQQQIAVSSLPASDNRTNISPTVAIGSTYQHRVPPASRDKMTTAINDNSSMQDIFDQQRRSSTGRANNVPIQRINCQLPLENVAKSTNNSLLVLHSSGASNDDSEDYAKQQQVLLRNNNSYTDNTPTRPYPKKMFFIIANEFCERFSYYGLRTVLVLYFRSVLGLSDSGSTVSFHLFAALCYLTPILGAILGDSILGKYKTILYLSIVYFIGELTLVMSSIFWDLGTVSVLITWLGLLLIGIGTGGIKPCVAAFAGDQFLPNETKWRDNFFALFYGTINSGALISMFATPLLRSKYTCVGRSDCYPLAFGLPCLLIFIATIFFFLAHNYYHIAPLPEQNVIVAFCQCTWLALKRKLAGCKYPPPPPPPHQPMMGHTNRSLSMDFGQQSATPTSSVSSSCLSLTSSSENESKPVVAAAPAAAAPANRNGPESVIVNNNNNSSNKLLDVSRQSSVASKSKRSDHWLYLASDQFDANSIEEFRSVLGFIFLFLPTPVYWCLFDQQSSLWTLQATRMDGRLFNSNYILEADQMTVANPISLLVSIPLFQLIIYPSLTKCNLLTTPIQRMTTGGFLAALAFVASALIEFQVQTHQPLELPPVGYANLLLVNGLSECSIVEPAIVFQSDQLDDDLLIGHQFLIAHSNQSYPATAAAAASFKQHNVEDTMLSSSASRSPIGSLEPLGTRRLNSLPIARSLASVSNLSSSSMPANYKLSFKLASSNNLQQQQLIPIVGSNSGSSGGTAAAAAANQTFPLNSVQLGGCPFDSQRVNELTIGSLPDQSVHLLYIEQGNGKLKHKLFNESLKLPQPGKARVRLLFEFFGSYTGAKKRTFFLVPKSKGGGGRHQVQQQQNQPVQFNMTIRDGQVLLSDYIDIQTSPTNDLFTLYTNDSFLNIFPSASKSVLSSPPPPPLVFQQKQQQQQQQQQHAPVTVKLEQGTRNLLILHQMDANNIQLKQELLQDNSYRISMLYQLVPYTMISMSEVMFSLTALEFSYAMAPANLKSLVMSCVSLTTAFGNMLTVVVESFHPFSNIAHDFLFYAALMALDMLIFAIFGYYYQPYQPHKSSSKSKI